MNGDLTKLWLPGFLGVGAALWGMGLLTKKPETVEELCQRALDLAKLRREAKDETVAGLLEHLARNLALMTFSVEEAQEIFWRIERRARSCGDYDTANEFRERNCWMFGDNDGNTWQAAVGTHRAVVHGHELDLLDRETDDD